MLLLPVSLMLPLRVRQGPMTHMVRSGAPKQGPLASGADCASSIVRFFRDEVAQSFRARGKCCVRNVLTVGTESRTRLMPRRQPAPVSAQQLTTIKTHARNSAKHVGKTH